MAILIEHRLSEKTANFVSNSIKIYQHPQTRTYKYLRQKNCRSEMIKTSHSRLQDNKNMIKHLLIGACLIFNAQACAELLQGRVVGISDGDTVTLLDDSNTQHKIRLSGIDAPEKKQPFGQASKQSLSDLVYNKRVIVGWAKQDRYGRIVGKLLVDNMDMNLEQVKRGLAWHYTNYQKEQPFEDRLTYLHTQEDAIKYKRGLWQEPTPVAPWDWRKLKQNGN